MAEVKLDWTPLTAFNKDNIESLNDNISGVYRLSYTNDGGKNYYVFFVGKSENIKSDLLSFIKSENINNCIANHIKSYDCRFRYAENADSLVKEAAERQLYKFYQPSCNPPIPNMDENIIINVT